jgi:acyl-CoA hydrolase
MPSAVNISLSEEGASVTHVTIARDRNIYGFISGALEMKLIDDAALMLANRVAHGPVVIARADRIELIKPITVGDVLHAHARLLNTGYISINIEVDVYAERMHARIPFLAGRAELVLIAVDEKDRPRPLRQGQ